MVESSPRRRLVVNVRGCNSSGKTTLVRTFFNAGPPMEVKIVGQFVKGKKELPVPILATKVQHPELSLPVWILGPYQEKYGGCDKIQCEGEYLGDVIKQCSNSLLDGHFMYEGFRVSKAYNRSVEICRYVTKETTARFVWASLLTDYDEIVRRIKDRYRDGEREPNHSELKAVVSAMKGQADKAKWIVQPNPVIKLNGNDTPEAVYQELLSHMKELEVYG